MDSIKRSRFEGVCQELSNALQREHQAQQLLNEQSAQLEELSMRLNMHTAEEMEKNATISEAVKVSKGICLWLRSGFSNLWCVCQKWLVEQLCFCCLNTSEKVYFGMDQHTYCHHIVDLHSSIEKPLVCTSLIFGVSVLSFS